MGDPIKDETVEANPEVIETPDTLTPPPVTSSSSEADMAGYNQYIKLKAGKHGTPTAVLPFGIRVDTTPILKTRTNTRSVATMLANPEIIIKDEFKRQHPGWKYMWPIAASNETQAMIHSDMYKKVPYDQIDRTNPAAMVMKSPTDDVLWKSHVLVAVNPQVFFNEVTASEHEAIARTQMNRAALERDLNAEFGGAGYRGEVTVSDIRRSKDGS